MNTVVILEEIKHWVKDQYEPAAERHRLTILSLWEYYLRDFFFLGSVMMMKLDHDNARRVCLT